MSTIAQFGILFKETGLAGVSKKLSLLTAGLTGAYFAFDRLSSGVIEQNAKLKLFARTTGLSVQELEKFQQAAQLSNINLSEDQILGQVEKLQNNITNILTGLGGDVGGFQLLGIDVSSGNAFNVIEQVRESIRGLDDVRAVALLDKVGIDRNFLPVLRQTRVEFDKLGRNNFLSNKQRRDIDSLAIAWKRTRIELNLFRQQAVAKLAPLLEGQFKRGLEWLQDNKDTIISFFSGAAKVTGVLVSGLGNIFEMVSKLTNSNSGLFALAGIGALLAKSFMPFTSGMALAFIVLEDIASFFAGKDSYTGDLVKFFKNMETWEKYTIALTAGIIALSTAFGGLGKSMAFLAGGKMLAGLKALGLTVLGSLGSIAALGTAVGVGAKDLITGSDTLGVGKGTEALTNKFDILQPRTEEETRARYLEMQSRVVPLTNNNANNNITLQNTININGAENPQEIQRQVMDAMNGMLTNAMDYTTSYE